jgi:hypothetical protein
LVKLRCQGRQVCGRRLDPGDPFGAEFEELAGKVGVHGLTLLVAGDEQKTLFVRPRLHAYTGQEQPTAAADQPCDGAEVIGPTAGIETNVGGGQRPLQRLAQDGLSKRMAKLIGVAGFRRLTVVGEENIAAQGGIEPTTRPRLPQVKGEAAIIENGEASQLVTSKIP